MLADPSPTPSSDPKTGLEGTISISPVHGGPIRPDIPHSKPLPHTKFVVHRGNEIVTSFVTDEHGRFRVALAPGHYTVSLEKPKGRMGHYGPFEAVVIAGQVTQVNWQCDTGIR